ncbi:MAG TPA: hypothetical protein VFR07_14085 [Mycobacteriales bacterium]|nr:hypothetical protein [Mycobacteriales bacterium]
MTPAGPGVAGGLLGSAVLVNRAELAASVAQRHGEWVVREHLPERLAIPGFLRGRRYVAALPDEPGAVRYATLYETSDVAVLASPAYLDRLDRPTERTRSLTGASRAGRRTAARVVSSAGGGTGGLLVLAAFPRPPEDAAAGAALAALLAPLAQRPGVLAVHLCQSVDEVTTAKEATCEAALAPGRSGVREWLVLVEAYEQAAAAEVRDELRAAGSTGGPLLPGTVEDYRLQVLMTAT